VKLPGLTGRLEWASDSAGRDEYRMRRGGELTTTDLHGGSERQLEPRDNPVCQADVRHLQ